MKFGRAPTTERIRIASMMQPCCDEDRRRMPHLAQHAQADQHLRVDHGVLHISRELLPKVRLHVDTSHPAERDRADHRKRERWSGSHAEDMGELTVPLDLEQDLVTQLKIAL